MFKSVSAIAEFNTQTGYGIHATNFFRELNNLIPVLQKKPGGDAVISLLDSVTAQKIKRRLPQPSVLYNVWESTMQPDGFMDALGCFDQLWVPSEWQRQCSIEQGVDPEFVKVVPEGVDPSIFKPGSGTPHGTFDFLIVGKWELRKYTLKMIRAWLEVFKDNENVRLYVAADNMFALDGMQTTQEKLAAAGIDDPRVIPISFESQADHVKRLQSADVYLSCSMAEGWNLPLIEAMACGIPSIALDYSGSTEFAKDALLVRPIGYARPREVNGFDECPGVWAIPDYEDLKRVIKDAHDRHGEHQEKALETSRYIRANFSWKRAAEKAYEFLQELHAKSTKVKPVGGIEDLCAKFVHDASKIGYEIGSLDIRERKDVFVIGCWPSNQERMNTLVETISQIKNLGYPVVVTSHYPLPATVTEMVDYYIYEKENILSDEDFHPVYSRVNQQGQREEKESNVRRHDVACLSAIRNAIDFCYGKFTRMFWMEFDLEVDLDEWIAKVMSARKNMVFIDYEKSGYRTDIFAGDVEALHGAIPRVTSWKDYVSMGYGYVLEGWVKAHIERNGLRDQVALVECEVSNRFDQVDRNIWDDDVFAHHFIEGPLLQIAGISNRVYDVIFRNPQDGDQYRVSLKCGAWARPATKYYRDWEIIAMYEGVEKFRAKLDLKDKRVLISLGSKALGDTLAWMPFIEEFRKKHQCHVIASSWWNRIFDYPEIEFVEPGSRVDDLYASYEIGCYDGDRHRNPVDWRTVTLQKVAADILGLEYKEIRPALKIGPTPDHKKPYVCFSEHSTMQAKLWNCPGGWESVIKYLNDKGFDVFSISKEQTNLKGVISANGASIEDTIALMDGCYCYIGLGHGPSWLAWALGVPVVLISGFSEPWAEFPTPHRVINNRVCHGCFNDPDAKFDRSWEWCPREKNYECTKAISPKQVIKEIAKIII